ncbi:MAG: hypothetical protein JKY92_01490 [Magnetovibrio sp.]|nr:hypothetical protein [Magnetovibrio sp.]
MKKYSPYFTTIYDEQEPTGYLGRGTHYSILRATSWHSPNYDISPRAYHFDFAIIWDEDHDTRVIGCVEEIYLNGLLSKFIMFGERKAFFTAVISNFWNGLATDKEMNENIQWIAKNTADGDHFNAELISQDDIGGGIIADNNEKVTLYLSNINMLWKLGGKIIPSPGNSHEMIPFPNKF